MRNSAAIAAFVLLCASAVTAVAEPAATAVRTSCAQLSIEQADELASRISLTLSAAVDPATETELPRRVVVACDESSAWVIWDVPPAEVLPVAWGPQFTEAVLEAIEARLRRKPSPQPVPRQTKPEASPKPAPPQEPKASPRPTEPVYPVAKQFTHGGLSLGASIELLPEPLTPPVGARFDVGVGVGPLTLVLAESARVGSSNSGQTFGYDMGAGVAWGAPFDARQNLGAKALVGVDWFSSGGAGAGSSRSSGVVELGAVGALYVSDYALWLGIAGRYRMRPQRFGSPAELELPHFSGLLSVGGAVLVNVSRRSERD